MKKHLIASRNKSLVVIVLLKCGNKYWIHQRRADKRVYPGLWGIGIGGKVDSGEMPLEAALRELYEESGIESKPESLNPLGEFDWDSEEISYHGFLYHLDVDPASLRACPREFQDHLWIDPNGIEAKKRSGHLCPDTLYFWDTIVIPTLSKQ